MERECGSPLATIACGGTGGHLFPGVAVARALKERGVEAQLLVSSKAVDEIGSGWLAGVEVVRLPVLPFSRRGLGRSVLALCKSVRMCAGLFRRRRPCAVLAMGGFASAPAVVCGRLMGIPVFLHEANAVPGRANRWFSRFAREVFVYFPEAGGRLKNRRVCVSGMPVRGEFERLDRGTCCKALGLDARSPVLLVMGGSQGARPLNGLMEKAVGMLAAEAPELQYVHLTGAYDVDLMRRAYEKHGVRAVVEAFFREMWVVLGAATLAVTRAGASSLAEQAAVRLPAILIPFPYAADDHQYHNARAFEQTGAACVLRQSDATPETVARLVLDLLRDRRRLEMMRQALGKWHVKDASERIADALAVLAGRAREGSSTFGSR
ncbi:MAG: undecaprenyldiphospho-muramoylpentapeptide beta-N-acetylglucosaminyltransferase, partial [Verrucomicrobiia bacterium]